jgi:hypothetical protein
MKERFLADGILLTSILTLATAQPPINFFPHHVGDVWQYRSAFTGEIVLTEFFIKDSVDQVGNTFIWYKEPSWVEPNIYKIDTLNSVDILHSPSDTANLPLLYRLSADSGVGWTFLRSPWDSVLARVVRVFPASVFGHPVTMKKIEYIGYPPSGGSWLGNRYLATGFGLVRWEIEPSDVYVLSGAIIDSVHYGTIVDVSEKMDLPMQFQLHQNYPNPFNPTTTIEFEMPQAERATIRIYDVLGRQVETLFEGRLDIGTHRIVWNARTIPSGVYFCRMRSQGITLTIKMLLTK